MEPRSVGVEVRAQLLFRHEPRSLANDGATRSRVQFRMGGNGESLVGTIRQRSTQLDVAAALGVSGEPEPTEDGNDLRAGEAAQVRHAPAATPW